MQEQRAVMDEFANNSTDATGISEGEASIEEMHHVSLYQKSLLRGAFPELDWIPWLLYHSR